MGIFCQKIDLFNQLQSNDNVSGIFKVSCLISGYKVQQPLKRLVCKRRFLVTLCKIALFSMIAWISDLKKRVLCKNLSVSTKWAHQSSIFSQTINFNLKSPNIILLSSSSNFPASSQHLLILPISSPWSNLFQTALSNIKIHG